MQLANGHTYEEVEPSAKVEYQRNFPGFMNDMIVLQPGGMVLPRRYLQFQQKIFDFKVSFANVTLKNITLNLYIVSINGNSIIHNMSL